MAAAWKEALEFQDKVHALHVNYTTTLDEARFFLCWAMPIALFDPDDALLSLRFGEYERGQRRRRWPNRHRRRRWNTAGGRVATAACGDEREDEDGQTFTTHDKRDPSTTAANFVCRALRALLRSEQ